MKLRDSLEALTLDEKTRPSAAGPDGATKAARRGKAGPSGSLDSVAAERGGKVRDDAPPGSAQLPAPKVRQKATAAKAAATEPNYLTLIPPEILSKIHAHLEADSLAMLTLTRKSVEPQERQALLEAWEAHFTARGWPFEVDDDVSLPDIVSRYTHFNKAALEEVGRYIESLRNDRESATKADAKLGAIRDFVAPHGSSMTTLDLYGFPNASLEGLEGVWRKCPNLQRLVLPDDVCLRSFDEAARSLQEHRKLTDLKFLWHTTNRTSVARGAKLLANLQTIRLRTIHEAISYEAANTVLKAWPNLRQLDLSRILLATLPARITRHVGLRTLAVRFEPGLDLSSLAHGPVQHLQVHTKSSTLLPASTLKDLTHLECIDLRQARLDCKAESLPEFLRPMLAEGRLLLNR